MNQHSNAPKPFHRCILCLHRLGFGYNRISNILRITRKKAYVKVRASKLNHIRVLIPRKATILKSLKPAIDKAKLAEERAHKALLNMPNKKRKIYLRTKVWKWFKHGLHPHSSARLVGCSRERFRRHIASQFQPGMTFENYAQVWQLDHIMPCSKFDLRRSDHRKLCFHFTNYQPLFCRDNKKKAARVTLHQPQLVL